MKEFLNLFSKRVQEFFSGRRRPLLVVAVHQDGVAFDLLNGVLAPTASRRVVNAVSILAEIDRFLLSQALRRRDVDIGLRLPSENIFCRRLLLPVEASDVIDTIVAEDLAKKTPFRAEDIYSDYIASKTVDGRKIEVRQLIIRRQFVHQELSSFDLTIDDVVFIVSSDRNNAQVDLLISLRRNVQLRNSWREKAVPVLCCCALVLALLSGGLRYINQQAELDRLSAETAATGSKAAKVRKLADQLREQRSALLRLRLQRSEAPGLIDVWEEVTRVLPVHTWLTEFRLTETMGKREEQVAMVGFSSAAPSLVALIDGSHLFFDAALTSPVAFDAAEGGERFSLQAKVRLPDIIGKGDETGIR